jgi:hypothetical protein
MDLKQMNESTMVKISSDKTTHKIDKCPLWAHSWRHGSQDGKKILRSKQRKIMKLLKQNYTKEIALRNDTR